MTVSWSPQPWNKTGDWRDLSSHPRHGVVTPQNDRRLKKPREGEHVIRERFKEKTARRQGEPLQVRFRVAELVALFLTFCTNKSQRGHRPGLSYNIVKRMKKYARCKQLRSYLAPVFSCHSSALLSTTSAAGSAASVGDAGSLRGW